MTSLQDLLPHAGSTNWRKSRSLTSGSDEDLIVVRHVVIREVWLEKRPWPHAVYKIDVMSQTSHWFVFKRYKEFYQLHQQLIKHHNIPKDLLPPRKIANNMARGTLENRREALEHYLQKLLNSCNGAVRRSEELSNFLDVKAHDVPHVTHDLAKYIIKHGRNILMSKEMFQMSPSQLYCATKQLQLPHPSGKDAIDLGNLYEFMSELKRLSITDFISQMSNGEQYEIAFTFDLAIFTSLRELQIDAINVESIKGIQSLTERLNKMTARHCLTSMKSILIDAAIEKRTAPQISLSAENWRIQAAYRLSENRIIFQPWHSLTYLNFSHNSISTFDGSMALLPALKMLDLSHNKINHLDLELLTSPSLSHLSLANNAIYLISGTTKPLDNLTQLNLSHNKLQSMEGLLSCQALEELNLAYNNIMLIGEVKKLASLKNLTTLSVDGNHFAKRKRHRIIIFAYFRERQLLLDKRPMTQKEMARLNMKYGALERFEDIDDSLSNISTVSDDSEPDSGYDHSNWVSKLAALSEIEEDDYEVIPRLQWAEVHGSDSVHALDESLDVESIANPNEMLTREDWDRILRADTTHPVPLIRHLSNESDNNTLHEHCSKPSTICNDPPIISPTDRGVNPNIMCSSSTPVLPKHNDINTDTKSTRTSSWVSNLFRWKTTSQQDGITSSVDAVDNSDQNIVVIPEIEELTVCDEDVSRSFEDSSTFECAEECDEN